MGRKQEKKGKGRAMKPYCKHKNCYTLNGLLISLTIATATESPFNPRIVERMTALTVEINVKAQVILLIHLGNEGYFIIPGANTADGFDHTIYAKKLEAQINKVIEDHVVTRIEGLTVQERERSKKDVRFQCMYLLSADYGL